MLRLPGHRKVISLHSKNETVHSFSKLKWKASEHIKSDSLTRAEDFSPTDRSTRAEFFDNLSQGTQSCHRTADIKSSLFSSKANRTSVSPLKLSEPSRPTFKLSLLRTSRYDDTDRDLDNGQTPLLTMRSESKPWRIVNISPDKKTKLTPIFEPKGYNNFIEKRRAFNKKQAEGDTNDISQKIDELNKKTQREILKQETFMKKNLKHLQEINAFIKSSMPLVEGERKFFNRVVHKNGREYFENRDKTAIQEAQQSIKISSYFQRLINPRFDSTFRIVD